MTFDSFASFADAVSGPVLFVHAHPDDESLATGIAIAHLAGRGVEVHVLTCTLGEEGEVIPPELAHLEGAPGDPLAPHRRAELADAVAALGAQGHLLTSAAAGEHTAYRDSGMSGSTALAHPRAFAGAPLDEVAQAVGDVIDDLAPHAVVTYDAHGGYGHPDHVRVHEAVRAALARRGSEAPAMWVRLTPRSWELQDRAWLAQSMPQASPYAVPAPEDPFAPSVVDDDVVTHAVKDASAVTQQSAALRAHATQVIVGEGWYALSHLVAARLSGCEGYARCEPETGALVGVTGAGDSA